MILTDKDILDVLGLEYPKGTPEKIKKECIKEFRQLEQKYNNCNEAVYLKSDFNIYTPKGAKIIDQTKNLIVIDLLSVQG